jgi:tetratricopeptide (TPR) repeat protein
MTAPQLITAPAAEGELAALLALAGRLAAAGAPDQAAPLLAHLKAWRPDRSDVRIAFVECLAAAGRGPEAIDELIALRAFHPADGGIAALVQAQGQAAMEAFNAHLAAGEMETAERYAAALARLSPANPAILHAAMSCNRALGRTAEAEGYAKTLLATQPDNADAARVAAGDSAPVGDHPLIQLRDLSDEAGRILCEPLTPAGEARLAEVLAQARATVVPVEAGSEWEAWARHYDLLVEALDMDLALSPPPKAKPAFTGEIADAKGAALDLKSLKARAKDAQAVFFAAADEAYVELYARWYALSVIRFCDTPFLVMIHVIGGAGRLSDIAAQVGIDDERLVFTADDCDIAAIATRSVDAPPKGVAAKPLANLQSTRFQRLPELLEHLKRPVFVSDIDLILQRGVADLLERTAGDDLDLNENSFTTSAGSRITANLVLARPTPGGKAFAAALAGYLSVVLDRPAVTRWIDQVALTLARHNLARNAPQARIGYFDTESDINNVMYPSYQEHPFRFLSLYHGFDTSSLEEMGLD